MDTTELKETLASVRSRIAEQGRIVDDRLLEKERQLVDALEWAALDDFDNAPVKASNPDSKFAKTEQFPCEHCGGTGFYRGVRIHETREHCFACKGKGYFLSSRQDREKARQQRVVRKEKQEAERMDNFDKDHPELYLFLMKAAGWSSFASDMLGNIRKYGHLTERQLDACESMRAKCEEREAAKAAEQAKRAEANKLDINLDKLFELFGTATGNGLKRPKLVVDSLAISKAPDHGQNAGCLYLKWNGGYAGKITPVPELRVLREYNEERPQIEQILRELADNPLEYAKLYGQRTGVCCCCGRELTNAESIELGIGPICLSKWGL